MRRFGPKPQCIQKRDAESDGFCQAGKVRALMLSADVTAFKKTRYFLMFMSEGKEVLCCRTHVRRSWLMLVSTLPEHRRVHKVCIIRDWSMVQRGYH